MPGKEGVGQSGFHYSPRVRVPFLSRDSRLEALHRVYANAQEVEQATRHYLSELLRGWMGYLEDDEFVALDINLRSIDNGKQAQLIGDPYSGPITAVRYNFVNDSQEAGTEEIKYDDFKGMNPRERQQLVEQHPEILMPSEWMAYDAVLNKGVLPQTFIRDHRGSGLIAVRAFEGFLQPEGYISDLDLQQLLHYMQKLSDDTHVYSIDGKRKGEVCLACKRVDP